MATVVEVPATSSSPRRLRVVSLFSGIGGGDLGLTRAGHDVIEFCESWEPARRVLNARFPDVRVAPDVRSYTPTVAYDLLMAGFPCVDLSHAGAQRGIFGPQSGLVEHVFRIAASTKPAWIVLENVPNLIRLHRGAGIRFVTSQLEELGYHWAYRTVDSRSFGVAQRRNRVFIVASLTNHPGEVLFPAQDTLASNGEADLLETLAPASGFYWTEGRRGVGLVSDAVPTLKGGSTLGLPSSPAVWIPGNTNGARFVLPTIEDAEALQGFPRGWTAPADLPGERTTRYKLVGNAITVGAAEWLGHRLADPGPGNVRALDPSGQESAVLPRWPEAATGVDGALSVVAASRFPLDQSHPPLLDFITLDAALPLSHRATRGFLSRVAESGIRLPERLVKDLENHLSSTTKLPTDTPRWITTDANSDRMRRVKQRDTSPELALRKAMTRLGLRYRLQVRPEPALPWRSDIVFRASKVVVDVRGCFWHACPIHQTSPKTNSKLWAEKLEKNKERDLRMEDELATLGWAVLTVWEHEKPADAALRVQHLVQLRKAAGSTYAAR